MADTETPRQKPPQGDANWIPAPNSENGGVCIALSEENLAALLGSGTSAPKPVPPVQPAEVPATLAPLSLVQEKPVAEVPVAAPPVFPRRSETVDSTLALFTAIKESRAEAVKAEAPVKPAAVVTEKASPVSLTVAKAEPVAALQISPPAAPTKAAPVPAATTVSTPAARSKSTVFPASAGQPAQIPTWAAQRPAQSSGLASVLDKIPGGKKTVLIAGVVIAIGGVSAGLLTRSHGSAKAVPVAAAAAPAPAATVNNFPLQLQAAPEGNGSINLRWNPRSTLIDHAREGRLVITEANQKPRTVTVSLEQLKFGHMSYQAQSERVEFRLEVVDPSGAVAEESILTLVPQSTLKAASSAPQQNAAPATVQTPAQASAPAPAEEAPQAARPAARSFTPPSNQRPTVMGAIDAPPSLAGNSSPALPIPALGAQVPRGVAPPPPAPAAQQVQVADNIQAANLIKRVTPIYPTVAKAARIQGTVRFNAVISASGQIQNLQVLSGPPQLRQAASDAVRQWVYRPMLRNGQPVEVVSQIDVNFTLN
ncbi:MAG: TonB family protein [Bryobacterales bacterium]|nr:TonB family protein [Bryobacterales bacterium]